MTFSRVANWSLYLWVSTAVENVPLLVLKLSSSTVFCVFHFSHRPLVFIYWSSQLLWLGNILPHHHVWKVQTQNHRGFLSAFRPAELHLHLCKNASAERRETHSYTSCCELWVFSLFFCACVQVNLYLIDMWCVRPINVACMLKARKKSKEREIITIDCTCWAIKVRLIGRLSIHWTVIILGAPLWKAFECELIDAIVLKMTVLLLVLQNTLCFSSVC